MTEVVKVNDGLVLRWTIEALEERKRRGCKAIDVTRRGFDKRAWPRGPWDDEPDFALWHSSGLQCLIVREAEHGGLGGYVEVAKGHPLHSYQVEEPRVRALDVLNGVSLAVPDHAGDYWLFGFTSSEVFDYCPAQKAAALEATAGIVRSADAGKLASWVPETLIETARKRLPELRLECSQIYDARRDTQPGRPRYHRYAFVRQQVEHLAAQLAAMVKR